MDTANDSARRKAFLSRIAEQFQEVAAEIGEPYRAEAWPANDEAVLRINREGQEDDALRVVARFVDDGDGMEEKLVLLFECNREVTWRLGLGWNRSAPDVSAGLDSLADRVDDESAYSMGKVMHALRADVLAALKGQPASASRELVARRRSEPVTDAGASFDDGERAAEAVAPRPEPNIRLLESALGKLATLGGLKAADVFADFIEAVASGGEMNEGDVTAYAQGALLELSFFYGVFLRGNGVRASDLGMEGGALRDAIAKAKAAFFEQDVPVRWQVARVMVTGMRLYYDGALESQGVTKDERKATVKSAFGRARVIANDAIAILAEPEPAKGGLRRLLGRKTLE